MDREGYLALPLVAVCGLLATGFHGWKIGLAAVAFGLGLIYILYRKKG